MEAGEIVVTGASYTSIYHVNRREVQSKVTSGQSSLDCCCTKLMECVPGNPKQFVYHVFNGKLCIVLNSYMTATFVSYLAGSQEYRIAWLTYIGAASRRLFILEILPDHFYLDKAWGRRVEYLARERAEVESAFSWLSTLGGAFSALGDSFDHCAVMAGRISSAQLKLAVRLGDPIMRARCYLYLALSLAQQGYLKKAKHIVKIVKKSQPCLSSICQGVNAHFFRLKRSGS